MTVLIVEDDFFLRESLRLIASESGSKVYTAENGQEALSLLSSDNSFDLMITDWDMPVLGGYELVQKAASSYPNMRIVVFSGSVIEVTERISGVVHLRKPSDLDKLLEILES